MTHDPPICTNCKHFNYDNSCGHPETSYFDPVKGRTPHPAHRVRTMGPCTHQGLLFEKRKDDTAARWAVWLIVAIPLAFIVYKAVTNAGAW